MENSSKISIVVALITVIFFGLWLKIISYNEVCGWQPNALENKISKEWPCNCIGYTEAAVTADYIKSYCTGINISYNKLLNLPITKNQQVPLYTEAEDIKTLAIKTLNFDTKEPIRDGTVVVQDINAKTVKEQSVDENGKTTFLLPQGLYVVRMKSEYTGKEGINLEDNLNLTLEFIKTFQ